MSDEKNVYEWLADRNMRKRYEPRPTYPAEPHGGTISGGPFDGAEFKIGLFKKTYDMTGQRQWRVWTGPYTLSVKKQFTESGWVWTVR